MIEQARKKDNGEYSYLGMKSHIASTFDVDINAESVKYITETYLECIEDISLQEWLDGRHEDGKPIILKREDLEEKYPDLYYYAEGDLGTIVDLFISIYNQEFWIDIEKDYLYTTEFTFTNRKRLNCIGIMMELERLETICEMEALTSEDINSIIVCLYSYGFDIKKYYEYEDDDIYETANNIATRIRQIFN